MKDSNLPRRSRSSSVVFAAAALAFLSTLLLSVRHNDFPFYYHPDEPAKVAQVLSGHRNFNHPPLMLTAAALVLEAGGFTAEPERAVQIGRWLSALYLSAANAILTVVAGFYAGAFAAVVAACLLVTDPQAVLTGHYFKEDPLLLLGWSLVVAAGAWRWQTAERKLSLLILGIAAGATVSAKYFGVLALAYASLLEALLPMPVEPALSLSRGKGLAMLWMAAGAAFIALNAWPVAAHFSELRAGFAQIERVALEGNDSIGAPVPHFQFVAMFFAFTSPVTLLGLGLALCGFTRRRNAAIAADRLLLALAPLGIVLVLCFSALIAARYLLPVHALAACAGSVSLAEGVRRLSRGWRSDTARLALRAALVVATLILALGWDGRTLLRYERDFGADDRRALRQWMRAHLPPGAVVAQDDLASLAGPVGQLSAEFEEAAARGSVAVATPCVLSRKAVADFGDLSALRAAGVTHVAVCRFSTRRYLDAAKRPAAHVETAFARRRKFYLQLEETARRLWKSELREPFPLRPGLEFYALDDTGAADATAHVGNRSVR